MLCRQHTRTSSIWTGFRGVRCLKPTRRFATMLIIGSLVSSFAGLSSAYQPAPYSGHPAVRVVPCTKTAHTRPSRSQAPAPAVNATAVPSSQACAALMVWPVTHPMVIKHFEQPSRLWSSRHRGVDLAAQPGDVIMAPASGTVRFSGDVAEKSVVSIEHDTGFIRHSSRPSPSCLSARRCNAGKSSAQYKVFQTIAGLPACTGE